MPKFVYKTTNLERRQPSLEFLPARSQHTCVLTNSPNRNASTNRARGNFTRAHVDYPRSIGATEVAMNEGNQL